MDKETEIIHLKNRLKTINDKQLELVKDPDFGRYTSDFLVRTEKAEELQKKLLENAKRIMSIKRRLIELGE